MKRFDLTRPAALRAPLLAACLLLATCVWLTLPRASKAAPPRPPTPIVNVGVADQITESTATLHGSISPNHASVSYEFEYGPTPNYGSQTPLTPLGAGETVHVSAPITGLAAGTLYRFRLTAIGPGGAVHGAGHTFQTAAVPLRISTLTASPNPLVFGESLLVNGSLAGAGSADHEVVLQANPFPYTSGFKDIGSIESTNATGGFSFTIGGLSQSAQLRVVTLGAPALTSPIATEQVALRVRLHARRTRRRGIVRLYGTVTPPEPGTRVALQWLKPGHAPITVTRVVVRLRRGTAQFNFLLRVRHRGLYRALVIPPSGAHASNQSAAIAIP